MPANLTPDYERAEQRYRAAADDDQRLEALREMFATIPKHKGTEKLQADLKRRISELRKAAHKKKAGGTDLFHVPRSGAGQVVLVGPPNVGKSLLVGKTTHAPVKVADYPFTTALPVPGMAWHHDVQIELVDTPPVTAEHIPGSLLGTIRAADIIALVVDAAADPLEEADMNRAPPSTTWPAPFIANYPTSSNFPACGAPAGPKACRSTGPSCCTTRM